MKKFLLLGLPFFVYGFDVEFNKTFSTSLMPNELSTSLNISSIKRSEKEVLSSLDVYTKFMKKADYIEKKSNRMSLYPQYKYKDGQSLLITYKGSVNYKILSSENSAMKTFFEEFYELEKDKDVSLSFSSLKWGYSKKIIDETTDTLRLMAIKWSKEHAIKLSTELNSQCQLKNIEFNSSTVPPRVYARDVALAKSSQEVSMPMPEQLEDEYSVRAHITMECK